MPGSRASVFGEPEDFEDALRADGIASLLVTGRGQFRARLTQMSLDRLRLTSAEEEVARVAVVAVPADTVLVSWPIGDRPAPVWGAIEMRAGEMLTLGPGCRAHVRTGGPCRWDTIRLPEKELLCYGRAMCGPGLFVPPAPAVWRPTPGGARHLAQLQRAAIRIAEARSGALIDAEAVHGLEQQLIHALIECLSDGPAEQETSAGRRHRCILARFEDLLRADASLTMTEICAQLGISERLLRACCKEHLRMGPNRYVRLQRMQQVHRALRSGTPGTASVSEVARRSGFRDPGRFAVNYRAVYGELPSATLRRQSGVAEFSLGRRRVKFS
jgi:AraC-like DNA-binding protein